MLANNNKIPIGDRFGQCSDSLRQSAPVDETGFSSAKDSFAASVIPPKRFLAGPNPLRSMQPIAARRRVAEGHKGESRDLGVFWHRPFSSASWARAVHDHASYRITKNASADEAEAC